MTFLRSPASTARKIFAGAGAVTVGVVLAGVSIEMGMRAAGYGMVSLLAYGHSHYNSELPELGYAGRPNVHGIQTHEGISEVAFNAHGFHDVEHSRDKPPGVFRIAVIGNSHSASIPVTRADGYVARLGEALRQCPALAGREIEPINLGVEGFTIHQQFLVLRDYGLSYSPDLVLLQTSIGLPPGDLDPMKNLSPRLEKGPDGNLVVDLSYANTDDFRQRASNTAELVHKLSDHSRLMQYILEFRRLRAIASAKADDGPANPALQARYREGRDLVVRALVDLLGKRRIPLAMTIIPVADAASYEPFQPEPARLEWRELAASVNVPLLEVEEEARAQVRATGAYLHGFGANAGSGHMNRAGNAFFGRALATKICKLLGDQQTAAQNWPLRLQ